ncbi:hypothetical protein [Dongia sp.]|uniref:hypothetical protein n=1 Tax=Dongia sp. TaxID=1977262 RepID=UPI0035B43A68
MVEKAKIAQALDEAGLLLPDLIDKALVANDRIKVLFSWLQSAVMRADHPDTTAPKLTEEARLPGLKSLNLQDGLGAASRLEGSYHVPGAKGAIAIVIDDLAAMLAPFAATGQAEPHAGFAARLEKLSALPSLDGDILPLSLISDLTHARRGEADSMHLLVMDMHKALNALQAGIAEESIDGARVYRIREEDRAPIAAFMKGLNRTAPLKYDHPGLGTTATRSGDRLTIQNDIGTTDAHVLVIHVEAFKVSLTYTDVHSRRLRFFQDRLKRAHMSWTDTRQRHIAGLEEDEFYQADGVCAARNGAERDECLAAIGAALVFLIDWNKARKRLRNFMSKQAAIELLGWAADNEIGHRGFLKLGGENLIYAALDGGGRAASLGRPLDQILGERETMLFMRNVLRTCTESLNAHRSTDYVAEQIHADLMVRIQSASDQVLDVALDHAALLHDLADLVEAAVMRLGNGGGQAGNAGARAKLWESNADRLVNRVRNQVARNGVDPMWRSVLTHADDAADQLEEVVFNLDLLPQGANLVARDIILRLVRQIAGGIEDYVRALSLMAHMHRGAAREDLRDLLTLIDRLRDMEHATDATERDALVKLLSGPTEPRLLLLEHEIAANLEAAGDAIMHAGFVLGDHVLEARLKG